MAVSSTVTNALADAATDGAVIAAAGLSFLVVMACFKYLRTSVDEKFEDVEKGLVIDERDPELLGKVRDYLADRSVHADNTESDGTYEYYYRNRDSWEAIGEFVSEGSSQDDNEIEAYEESLDRLDGKAANDSDYTTDGESIDEDELDEATEDDEGEELAFEPTETSNRSAQA
jgi:hypothetical protein